MSGRFGRQPFEGVRVPRNRGGRNIVQVGGFSDKIIEAHTRCPFQSVVPSFELHPRMSLNRRRDGRVAEGARLESVFRGNSNVGSNPTLSAMFSTTWLSCDPQRDPLSAWQSQTHDFAVCL